jgi:basic amino acid/polyamine antiporter, APA family
VAAKLCDESRLRRGPASIASSGPHPIKDTTINTIPVELGKPSAPGSLLRVLGKVFALTVVIGTTMGGGIFYTPGKIAALLPNAWLYMAVWAFGGISALLGATVFAELGAMVPLSGGPYPFARRALGDYAGFFVGYTQWVLDCAGNAALLFRR